MMKSTRDGYGEGLVEIGKLSADVMVLDADLGSSTRSFMFKKVYPDRFFNFGIAEGAMIDAAAGMAYAGKLPYASSFAVFITGRAFEYIRQSVCYPNNTLFLCGSHSGISVGEDGGSHQSVVDISLMRALPNMRVIVPADFNEARAAVIASLGWNGPTYLRTSRIKTEIINPDDYCFSFKSRVMREGSDITLISCGVMTAIAIHAANELSQTGINCEVINVSTIKPLGASILDSISKTGKVVTLEEHSIIGGLGSAVAELTAEKLPTKILRIGINDRFGQSGKADELFKHYGLDKSSVSKRISTFYHTR